MGSVQDIGKTWRENPAPWEVWEEGRLGRVLEPFHALSSSVQEEGMALHFNLRSKREHHSSLLASSSNTTRAKAGWPGLQMSKHSELSSSQQLSASSGQAPLNCSHLWVLCKRPGPLAPITQQAREQEIIGLERELGKLFGRR